MKTTTKTKKKDNSDIEAVLNEVQDKAYDIGFVQALRLLELLLESVTEKYPEDSVKPGVVMSFLGNGDYYVSICRYSGSARHVVKSFTFKSLEQAVSETCHFIVKPDDGAREALRLLIGT